MEGSLSVFTMLSKLSRNLLVCVVVIFIAETYKVVAERCSTGKYCESPYKCCEGSSSCCYDHDDHEDDDNNYTYGYRMSVWNMWYFWFVILFILMSCFGGCGYYKQRQRMFRSQQQLMTTQQVQGPQIIPRQVGRQGRTITLSPVPHSIFAYTGPASDHTEVPLQPPPYAEVMSQPGMYPINKSDLPPYPGEPVITADTTNMGNRGLPLSAGALNNDNNMPLPPPYTENAQSAPVTNQQAGFSAPANQQPTANLVTANQNAVAASGGNMQSLN